VIRLPEAPGSKGENPRVTKPGRLGRKKVKSLEILGFKGKLSFQVKCSKCKRTVHLILSDAAFNYFKCVCGCIYGIELVVKINKERFTQNP